MRQHAHGELMQQFMVAHPHLMRNVVEGIIKLETAQFSSQRMLENFFQTATVYQLAQRYLQEHETLLIEEGFCQQAYHVLASRTGDVSDDAIEEYLTLIPRPDYLLAVLTPPEECEERLRTRKKYPRILDELSFSEKMDYLQCRAAFHQRIIASLERQWHIPIIEVPNIRDEHPRAYLEQFMQRQSVYF